MRRVRKCSPTDPVLQKFLLYLVDAVTSVIVTGRDVNEIEVLRGPWSRSGW